MKKYIAFLLCLIMILSLFSCNGNNINEKENDHTNNDTTDEITSDNPSQENVVDYSKILNMYRSIIEILPNYVDSKEAMNDYCAELGIVNEEEKELFKKLFWSTFDFKKSPPYRLSCGYATKDLNGDGMDELVLLNNEYYIMAIFSYADGNPILLGNYWPRNSCWIDGDGLLHNHGSSGADYSTNAVYKIADGGKELELIVEYGTNGYEWIEDVAYTIYYKLVNGEKKTITEAEYQALNEQYGKYLGSIAGSEATKEYSELTFTSLYTEAEIAMEMYEQAIKGEICIIDEHLGEIKLKVCRFPNNNLKLEDSIVCGKAILDLDQDGISECIIEAYSHDSIVLHYYDGKVYSFALKFEDFNNLKIDGSFLWTGHCTYSDKENSFVLDSGAKKLMFEGSKIKFYDIFKTVYDNNQTAKHYIGNKSVTYDEITEYKKEFTADFVEYTPFDAPWYKAITEEEAIRIASEYWNIKSGDVDEATGYRFALLPKHSENSNYCIALSWLVEGTHYSTLEMIEIDAFTGEIIVPTYEPDGKG